MFTVFIENQMTDKTLCNILQGAFDGGINYWCREVGLWSNTYDPDMECRTFDKCNELPDYAFDDLIKSKMLSLVFNYDHNEEDDRDKYSIGFTMLEPEDSCHIKYLQYDGLIEGLEKWMKQNKRFSVGHDGDHLDAGDCDEIVQIALFGKVIYG
tara:strand:- start:19125 stop:19586 length:462 start_codon:yes stop_codon:yes gene_type:complete